MYIYKITNLINGKCYIGQTTQKSVKRRWNDHKRNVNQTPIQLAIQKNGQENFSFEVIDNALSIEELNKKEQYWIEHYDCISPKGYNLTSGGLNKQYSNISKVKMSSVARNQNRYKTEYYNIYKSRNRWAVNIGIFSKRYYSKTFETIEEAIIHRDEVMETLKNNPEYTLEYVRNIFPYSNKTNTGFKYISKTNNSFYVSIQKTKQNNQSFYKRFKDFNDAIAWRNETLTTLGMEIPD